MASSSINIREKQSSSLPQPILNKGYHYELQHSSGADIDGFITSTFYDRLNNITQTGADFANQDIKIGVSLPAGDNSFFLENTPMIFMEVFDSKLRRSNKNKGDKAGSQWVHPCNFEKALNNNTDPITGKGRNVAGNGPTLNKLVTEYDFTNTEPFQDLIISVRQKQFYNDPNLSMPERKVDWSINNYNRSLKKLSRSGAPTGVGPTVVTSYTQPIRFRFVCIDPTDPSKRNLIYGPPSETLLISPKGGYFKASGDHYWYGWKIHIV